MVSDLFTRKRVWITSVIKDAIYGCVNEYETPKIVLIHSLKYSVMFRILQIFLLFYSIFYLFLYEKGYQKRDSTIISSVTLKVKGIGYFLTSFNQTYTIDGADYIIPPSENNAMFIMTNFIQTDQNRSQCSESKTVEGSLCQQDSDCQNRQYNPKANGRLTGRCLLSENVTQSNETIPSMGICEIQGWCPVEDDHRAPTIIEGVLNFTIFVKNNVEFPKFGIIRTNMIDNLKPCIYDAISNKDCPIFRIGDIIKSIEAQEEERRSMLYWGSVIRMKLDWNCDFDKNIKLCKPIYSFRRLDSLYSPDAFSVGFNFRFATYWMRGKRQYRTLKKAHGLRLIISVSGKSGKFDFITLTLNIGSLVGIFGLATYFCDFVILYLSKNSHIYRNFVFQRVDIKTCDKSMNKNSSPPPRTSVKNSPANNHSDKISRQSYPSHGTVKNTWTADARRRPLLLINPNALSSSNLTLSLRNATTAIR